LGRLLKKRELEIKNKNEIKEKIRKEGEEVKKRELFSIISTLAAQRTRLNNFPRICHFFTFFLSDLHHPTNYLLRILHSER